MRSTLLTLALSTLAAAPALAAPGGENWYADYDAALAVAKEQGKHLLVDFTGSDWCGWCKRLDAEVFSHDVFLEGVADDYVLVALDFPNAPELKAKVPNPQRNVELRDQWGIRGFPTILLVDTESRPYAATGYQSGGPEPYLEHLDTIAEAGKQTLKEMSGLVERLEGAEGAARIEALAALVDLLERQAPRSPFVDELVGYAMQAAELEGNDELRLRAITALLGAGIYNDQLGATIEQLDPKNERGLREQAIMARMGTLETIEQVKVWVDDAVALIEAHGIRDNEVARPLYINIAYMADKYLEQPERATQYAKKALALGGIEEESTLEMLRSLAGSDDEAS